VKTLATIRVLYPILSISIIEIEQRTKVKPSSNEAHLSHSPLIKHIIIPFASEQIKRKSASARRREHNRIFVPIPSYSHECTQDGKASQPQNPTPPFLVEKQKIKNAMLKFFSRSSQKRSPESQKADNRPKVNE
jgi:hypothetical protein